MAAWLARLHLLAGCLDADSVAGWLAAGLLAAGWLLGWLSRCAVSLLGCCLSLFCLRLGGGCAAIFKQCMIFHPFLLISMLSRGAAYVLRSAAALAAWRGSPRLLAWGSSSSPRRSKALPSKPIFLIAAMLPPWRLPSFGHFGKHKICNFFAW